VNTKFNVTKGQVLLDGATVVLECTADADPKPSFSFFGEGISPVTGSDPAKPSIKIDLSHDGDKVSCTPSNRLGNGPTVVLLIDVKGKIFNSNVLFGITRLVCKSIQEVGHIVQLNISQNTRTGTFLVQSEEFTLQLLWLGKIQSRQVWCKQSEGRLHVFLQGGTARVFPTPQICAFLIFFILPN
jgi:hypothetical protein